MSELTDNYAQTAARVKAACERSGRSPESVTLIAVSKTKPASDIRELAETGVKDFGENKVQEMCGKIEELALPLSWHLIGHLQTNKVKSAVGAACLIHSVDSFHLAKEIEKEAAKKGLIQDILIEVNIGDEESKSGCQAKDAAALAEEIAALPHVHVRGLMCVAPVAESPEDSRPYFRKLKEIRDEIAALKLPGVDMDELSMGMTGDFEVAVEEGATFVRVGTAIFGRRNYAV